MATLLCLVATLSFSSAIAAEPADSLAGPPFVSCKAWAIFDGSSGELLWGQNEDLPLYAASTTKIMCACVVLDLAKQQPSIMQEQVTFSELADKTTGSSARVRAGETLSVKDCLYGLLLPSGNDAGNALAEHFNDRFAPPEQPLRGDEIDSRGTSITTRVNFLAQMNRTARDLGMTQTFYRSPYGDGPEQDGQTTTARNLLHLAWSAMQSPVLRNYVATARHECQVGLPDGGTRTVVWENTNQLLGIEGYNGVKTGTNSLAGACLVSSGRRSDDQLLIAVLGSTSDDGRYVDTRNLFRWAWLQRGHRTVVSSQAETDDRQLTTDN